MPQISRPGQADLVAGALPTRPARRHGERSHARHPRKQSYFGAEPPRGSGTRAREEEARRVAVARKAALGVAPTEQKAAPGVARTAEPTRRAPTAETAAPRVARTAEPTRRATPSRTRLQL